MFDLPGALTATSGVTLLVFALVRGPNVGWGSPGSWPRLVGMGLLWGLRGRRAT